MKPVYRCDYCDVTGTEEEILKHEAECIKNPHNRGCFSCKHCETDGFKNVACKQGREIPDGKYVERCHLYEFGEPEVTGVMSLFSHMFD